MASGITIQVDGLKALQKKLGRLPQTLTEELDAEMSGVAVQYVNKVVAATPVDTGRLKGGTSWEKVAVLHYEIINNVEYAPYVEWGTVSYVSVPAELTAYAAQFKGNGLVKNGGMRPRPFFFIHIPWATQELNKQMATALKRALNK
jgi:hypothetical protein